MVSIFFIHRITQPKDEARFHTDLFRVISMRINNRSNCCLKWLFCLAYACFSLYVFMLTEVFQVQRFPRTQEYIPHKLASYIMDKNKHKHTYTDT